MLVAVAVGMITLHPFWLLTVAALGLDPAGWSGAVETESPVMEVHPY